MTKDPTKMPLVLGLRSFDQGSQTGLIGQSRHMGQAN
jgi:hypothetical protein